MNRTTSGATPPGRRRAAAVPLRRRRLIATAAPLLSAHLAACTLGSGAGSQAQPTRPEKLAGKLVFWGQSGSFTLFAKGVGAGIMDAFRVKHPELTLEVEDNLSAGVGQHIEQVLQYAVGGVMPDVLLAHRLAVPQFGQQGLVGPLDDPLKRSRELKRDDLWPSHLQDSTWKGKLYGITHSTGVWVQFVNAQLWREAGADPDQPARTWDDLQATARRVTRIVDGKIERLGFHPIWNNGGTLWFLPYLRQQGGDFLTADYKPAFNNERGTKALEFMKSFIDLQGGWPALDAFQKEVTAAISSRATGWNFGSGRLATALDSHTIGATLDEQFKDVKYTTAVLPLPPGGKQSGLQGGTALTLPVAGKQRDAAWALIEHLMAPQNILDFSLGLTRIPARRSVGHSAEYLQNDPRRKAFIEMVPHSFWTPPVPGGHELADVVAAVVNDTLQGKRGVRDALGEAENQTKTWGEKWRQYLQ
ncbi:MAG: extracellular solute-binding protein [Chloroflexota bacterium]|nr:extracellular solute-binding protein [Chloroflexota bacterium]